MSGSHDEKVFQLFGNEERWLKYAEGGGGCMGTDEPLSYLHHEVQCVHIPYLDAKSWLEERLDWIRQRQSISVKEDTFIAEEADNLRVAIGCLSSLIKKSSGERRKRGKRR